MSDQAMGREGKEREAVKALTCLYIAVEEHVAKDVGRKVMAALNALREELANRQGQIDTLANFILRSVPGEPSQSQGAVDTAIRIITTLREELAQVTRERDLVLAEAVWAMEQVVGAMECGVAWRDLMEDVKYLRAHAFLLSPLVAEWRKRQKAGQP